MQINYIEGDALKPQAEKTLIFHCCNTVGQWGSGFVLAINKVSPLPKNAYSKWYHDTCFYTVNQACIPNDSEGQIEVPFMLGEIQVVNIKSGIYIVNAVCQKDTGDGYKDMPPVRYEALREALLRTVDAAKVLGIDTISGPRFCSDRAGGSWSQIESIINEVVITQGIKVDIYDLPVRKFGGALSMPNVRPSRPTGVEYSTKNCQDIILATTNVPTDAEITKSIEQR